MNPSLPQLDREHIRPGDRICAAVSGGADSVALLLLLATENSLARGGLGVGLTAVHVHHGLRGTEADEDLEFVEALCAGLSIPLRIERASVPQRVAQSRERGRAETVEEAARAVRYEAFERAIAEGHADAVLTGHTLDDQAETVLMKLLRGAWTEGLSGIHPVVEVKIPSRGLATMTGAPRSRAGRILRPLLDVRHAELCAYLTARGQAWREDSTNKDPAHTRNRVRHTLLPLLREENASVDRALAQVATLARDEEAHWQATLARILPALLLPGRPVRGGGRAVAAGAAEPFSVSVELERLRGFDRAEQRRIVRAAALTLGRRLSFEETQRLLLLCAPEERSGGMTARGRGFDLGGGLRADRTARELRLSRAR